MSALAPGGIVPCHLIEFYDFTGTDVSLTSSYSAIGYDLPAEDVGADFGGDDSGPTVVTLEDKAATDAGIPEADMEGWAEDDQLNSPAAAPSSSLKKRGRASLAASVTPAKSVTSKTPRSTKSTAAPKSAGRSTGKRKAAEPEPVEDEMDVDEPEEEEAELEATPAAKRRGRAARSAGVAASARLAAKAAKKPVSILGQNRQATDSHNSNAHTPGKESRAPQEAGHRRGARGRVRGRGDRRLRHRRRHDGAHVPGEMAQLPGERQHVGAQGQPLGLARARARVRRGQEEGRCRRGRQEGCRCEESGPRLRGWGEEKDGGSGAEAEGGEAGQGGQAGGEEGAWAASEGGAQA